MSLDEFKEDFCQRLQHPRVVKSNGYEPVWFLVYAPKRTVEMQRFRTSLKAYLSTQGMEPQEFSVTDALWSVLESDPDWAEVQQADEDTLSHEDLKDTLSAMVEPSENENRLVELLRQALQKAGESPRAVLLVHGFESLHCLMRPGIIEGKLNGCFACPTVFFYPGRTEGKAGLRFVNFYPVDSNYHSEHLNVPEA